MSWTKEPWGGGADSFKEPWASDYKPRHLPGTLAAWVAWLHAALLGASRNTGQRHCGCHSCLIRTQESRTTGFWRSQHRPRPLQSEALDSLGCGLWFQPLHFLGDDLGSLLPCGDWPVGSPGGWGYTCTQSGSSTFLLFSAVPGSPQLLPTLQLPELVSAPAPACTCPSSVHCPSGQATSTWHEGCPWLVLPAPRGSAEEVAWGGMRGLGRDPPMHSQIHLFLSVW